MELPPTDIASYARQQTAAINKEAIDANACPKCFSAVGVPCMYGNTNSRVHAARLNLLDKKADQGN